LPNQVERKQILALQLSKRNRDAATFDLERIATAAQGFSGAEIEAAVQSALYAAFSKKQELSTQILLGVISQTVPLSVTRAEEIEAQRAWAKTRAVPASAQSTKGESA
jgi:SpoVK/Ycf46/Vps4 family AAA+-type ATPase